MNETSEAKIILCMYMWVTLMTAKDISHVLISYIMKCIDNKNNNLERGGDNNDKSVNCRCEWLHINQTA